MLAMEITPATVILGLIVAALAFLAIRRLVRNGTCDCHKDDAHSGSCASGCGGCAGCSTVDKMVADMQQGSKPAGK